MYRLLIFDMDGTFIDTREFHSRVFEDFLGRHWRDPGYGAIYRGIGGTVRELFEMAGVPGDRMPGFYGMLEEYYGREAWKLLGTTRLADGFLPFAAWLRGRGVRLAVVTNSLKSIAGRLIDHHGCGALFDAVEGADADAQDKRARCRALFGRFGIPPGEALYVGDTEGDMELADAVGCDACFMHTGIAWCRDAAFIKERLRPAIVARSYGELLQTLQTRAGPEGLG